MAHNPYRHTRNKTSVGSINYADLANTLNRPAPGLQPMIQQQHTPTHGPPQRQAVINQDHRQEALRRISATPTDREIPDGVDERVIGDVVQRYRALREVERKLDAIMMNKRLAAKDSGQRYERRLRVMRVWISSTSPEKEQNDTRMEEAFDFGEDAGGGAYKLKIEGRLLPDPDDEDEDDLDEVKPGDGETMDLDQPDKPTEGKASSKPYFERHKLSHYFKQITVTFDPSPHALPNAAPPAAPIEWKKPEVHPNGVHPTGDDANFDCLTIERKCDEAVQNVTITMHRAEPGRRFRGKLSEPLAKILDREYEDLSSAMMGLHSYVRLNGLEVEGHPQHFRCDDALKAIFKTDTSNFVFAPDKIAENIQPLPPITLPFTIRISSTPSPPTIYDIPLLVDDPLEIFTSHLRNSTNPHNPAFVQKLKDIATLDSDIALAVQGMYSSKAKIEFMNQLGSDPVVFVKKWISAQRADEETILGEERGRGPEWSKGGPNSIWGSDSVREGVSLVLARGKPVGH